MLAMFFSKYIIILITNCKNERVDPMSTIKKILYVVMPVIYLVTSNYYVSSRPFSTQETTLF